VISPSYTGDFVSLCLSGFLADSSLEIPWNSFMIAAVSSGDKFLVALANLFENSLKSNISPPFPFIQQENPLFIIKKIFNKYRLDFSITESETIYAKDPLISLRNSMDPSLK
jgi:hypothetical protein